MSRIGNWVIEMTEDAAYMTRDEFIGRHGESNVDIWEGVHNPEFDYEGDYFAD